MAVNITTATATNVGRHDAIRITINNGWTGTIATTGTNTVTGLAATLGTITNPATGNSFLYSGLHAWGDLTLTTVGTLGDITVSSVQR